MVAVWRRARWALLLPLVAASLLLLPAQPASATGCEDNHWPTRAQIRNYKLGLEAWLAGTAEQDAEDRAPFLDKAERRMLIAAKGPGFFPEAWLALGLVRYAQNHIIEAEPPLIKVTEITHGAMRAEALTYLGLINLRSKRWEAAKTAFEESMAEDLADTTTSARRNQAEEMVEALRGRLDRLDCVARVGSVLATYYMARDPRSKPPGADDFQRVLAEMARLLPPDQMAKCASAFNGTDAAIARFPNPPVNWNLNLLDGLPAGVRAIPLVEFNNALRVWAMAELAFAPPLVVPSAADLTDMEKHNLAAGLLKRVLLLESQGNFGQALPIWVQLANFPETQMAARQHRIWILLNRPAGRNAPTVANIDAAKALIRGPLAADDPLLFEEQLALASALLNSTSDPDPAARRRFYQLAREEFRVILQGFPGIRRTAPEYVLRIAQWNLAVATVSLPETQTPAYWLQGLAEFPPLPGRERIRLFMAMKLAEAYLVTNQPAGVARALTLMDNIAQGRDGEGSLPVVNAAEPIRQFLRYLGMQAIRRNVVDAYRQGFLTRTEVLGEYRAWEAAELFKTFVQNLAARPQSIIDAPSTWTKILALLQEARGFTDGNTTLQQRLDADIRAARAYLDALARTPPRIYYPWNLAADRTNTAKTAADWDQAAKMWRDQLVLLQGGSAADRAEAAAHVVNAYLKKADLAFQAKDKVAAKKALDEARDALGVGPNGVGSHMTLADREMTQKRIDNNVKALGPGEVQLVPQGPVSFPLYSGGMIGPCRARCVIIHYSTRHQPDVQDWLNRLKGNPNALGRLVDWFNNGPMAVKATDAKRDFTPDSLFEFLSANVAPKPGILNRGAMQWCDHNGVGPWHSYKVNADTAAYYLTNGVPIINADCSNPLNPIRVKIIPPPEWMVCPEMAAARPLPVYPSINFGMPQAEFTFHVEGIFQPYALPLPMVVPVTILPPAISVLAVPEVMPKLHIPKC